MENTAADIEELQAIIHNYTFFFLVFDVVFFVGVVFSVILLIQYLKSKKDLRTSGDYLRYTIRGQEEERARIARELHDTIAQDLRYCRSIAEKIKDTGLRADITGLLSKSLSEVRSMSYNLAPPDVTNSNLPANIMNLCQIFQQHSDVEFRLVATEDLNTDFLTREENFNLYRIVQESLVNILKHAQAIEVTVLMRNEIGDEEKGLYIFVTDDGIGFDATFDYTSGTSHFGLVGMKQRAELIGAKIEISSELGEGSQVSIVKLCQEK